MITDTIFKSVIMAKVVDKRIYAKGNKLNPYIELEVIEMEGEYPPFQKLVTTRGPRKGAIVWKLQTWDYTNEHENRKVDWKLASNRKIRNGSQHISKMYPIGSDCPDKFWIDFGTLGRPNDIGLILFDERLEYDHIKTMKVFIVEDGRNDTGVIQMFRDTDFS